MRYHLLSLVLPILLVGCTFAAPQMTPTIPQSSTLTSAPPTATDMPTLIPSATLQPTNTPYNPPTLVPVVTVQIDPNQLDTGTGGGGAFAYGSTSGNGAGSSGGGQTAPIGVRETATPQMGTGSSGGGAAIGIRETATPTFGDETPLPPNPQQIYDITLNAGATLLVRYEVTLTSGWAVYWVEDANGDVIQRRDFDTSASGEDEIPIIANGTYTLYGSSANLTGNYILSYGYR
jgi:hypothetical protein